MWGPTPKYRGTRFDPLETGEKKVPLFWNVHSGGFPVREGDSPELIPKGAPVNETVIPYAQSQVFQIPKDLPEFTKVLDWIANGMAVKYAEERQPGKEDGTWWIWLTWFDLRGSIQIEGRR